MPILQHYSTYAGRSPNTPQSRYHVIVVADDWRRRRKLASRDLRKKKVDLRSFTTQQCISPFQEEGVNIIQFHILSWVPTLHQVLSQQPFHLTC